MRKFGNVLWGIVFIVLGLIIGLNSLGYTNINIFFKGWWTLFIIVPCFIGLFKSNNKTGDIIGLLIGLVLLFCMQGMLSFSLVRKMIFPAIFVVIGLVIIFGDFINKNVSKKIRELSKNKNTDNEYVATFSEQNINLQGEEFNGASLSAIFGSVNLDLLNTNITKDDMIEASAIFGGVTITAPKGVNVKVKSTPIFGGVSNKVNYVSGENVPTIYVNAFCLFGGVDIK